VNLTLPVKTEYFNEILSGAKKYEYRLYNKYWKKRIHGKDFKTVTITKGYPKREDESRRIVRPYSGYKIKIIKHPHFGNREVMVFAIKVN